MNQTLNIPYNKANNNNHLGISSNQESKSPIKVLITKYKARKEVNKIVKSLKEVKDFESGKKTPKSFDNFLKTL